MSLTSLLWRSGLLVLLLTSLPGQTDGDATCPQYCRCSTDSVTCRGSKLSSIPSGFPSNDTVSRLSVVRTNITSLTASSFSGLGELLSVDLSNNENLTRIEDGAFSTLPKLQSLTLRRNGIQQLTKDTFTGLRQLTFLDLSYNHLTDLPGFTFHELNNLEVLDLARNSIETETFEAFSGLGRLKTLNLTRNTLFYLESHKFLPLVSLENLVLDDCNVRIIPHEAFAPLVALKRLSLNGNQLRTFNSTAFLNLTDDEPTDVLLEDLSLRGTQLTELPVAMLNTLKRLRNLDLSNTSIENVKNASFSELRQLVNLTIDSCRSLKQIEAGAFSGLEKLQNLIITNNKVLKDIGSGAFKGLSSLKVLDLSGNQVEVFRADLANWEDIDLVDLRSNPIRCDCHTRWMLTLVDDSLNMTVVDIGGAGTLVGGDTARRQGMEYHPPTITTSSFTRQINCSAPPSLQGTPLSSLSADDFLCPATAPKPKPKKIGNENRFKVGLIASGITSVFLVSFALFVKFRKQICAACRGQYRYQAHKSNGINGGSPSAEAMELEDTQFEDLDSDAMVTRISD